MWKELTRAHLAHDRATRRTVTAAALAAAFFLALLGCLFHNLWVYEIARITTQEGGWQARVTLAQTGDGAAEAIAALEQFAHIESVQVNEALSDPGQTVLDLTFDDVRGVYRQLPLIAQRLGLDAGALAAHETLLSRYLVTNPQDPTPPLLLPFFLAVFGAVAAALVLLIRNAFAITMQSRLHQFGILSSVGATPRQLRSVLLQEAAALCALPLLAGTALGLAACWGVILAVNRAAAGVAGRQDAVFTLHPLVVASTLLASFLTVLLSAWLPARKLARLTPLQALRGGETPRRWKRCRAPLLSLCFGVRGELAAGALRAQRRSLRIANVSLLLSFLGFTAMLCFFTLSGISTRLTYFERYQDAWDVMATVQNVSLAGFSCTEKLQALPGAESCVVYEKHAARCLLPAAQQSEALQALGGLTAVAGDETTLQGDVFAVEAPAVVLDDKSFLAYCKQVGISPSLDGAILLDRVWDSLHSHFRARQYVPFVQPDIAALELQSLDGAQRVQLPLLGGTDTPPNLREEYDPYTLVQFWPQSLWETVGAPLAADAGAAEVSVRLLGRDGITPAECEALQAQAETVLQQAGYEAALENRIAERQANDRMIAGSQAILGAFCLLLAAIGLANVFLNTLGFVGQRRREFARYLSLGMTPKELRSLFWIEAAVIAGRPLAVTLPLTALVVAFMLQASRLDPALFWAEAPVLPIALFAALIVGVVALAYALGARRVLSGDLSEILKDDSLR